METKRAAILDAALERIAGRGIHGTTMAMIADGAGVGTGTIYRYYRSKDALIEALFERVMCAKAAAVLEGYDESQPLEARFRRLWRNMLHYLRDHPRETALIEQVESSPLARPDGMTRYDQLLQPLMRFYDEILCEGLIKEMPLAMVSVFFSDAAISLAKQHLAGSLVLDEALEELAISASWDALCR